MLARLKFNLDDLVNEFLDQIPQDLLINGTVFDPAIGGGQFVKEIERRKRAAGKSDDEIRKSVYGIEGNILRRNYAIHKHNLVGNYSIGDFLQEDYTGMKFDVIVGNPPYQESKEHGKKTTGNGALWVRFTVNAFSILKDNGYLAFITPDSWTAPTYDLMGSRESLFNDYFKKYNLLYINFDVKKFFPRIGIDPAGFILKKESSYKNTQIIIPNRTLRLDLSNMRFIPKDVSDVSLSIHSKVLSNKTNARQIKMRWSKSITSIKINETADDEYKYPFIDHHAYKPIRWANKLDPDFNKKKILVPYVGKYQCIIDKVGEYGARESVSVLFLNDNENVDYAEHYYNSKLVRFIMETNKWTQYVLAQILNYIPITDFTRDWTDADLYKFFKLTQEEIDYIENQV